MAGIIQCKYCARWQSSPIDKIKNNDEENNDEENNDDSKKKKKKKKIFEQYRICQLNNRKTKGNNEACTYFKPRLYFYCYNYKYWLSIFQCLSRRRNKEHYYKHNKKIFLYPDCTIRCAQFQDEILPICKKLKINRLGNIKREIPKKRIIKRRPKKRVIKRRPKARTITRR